MMGFGAHSKVIHTFKIERLSEDLPIVIEIVDSQPVMKTFCRSRSRASSVACW
jgi:PII-like signaling protein